MNEVDRTLAELARQQHQVFSREQAMAAGLTHSAIWRRVQSGQFVPRGTRAFTFAGVELSYRGQLKAGLLGLGPEVLVSGRAAAALHKLDGFEEGPLEYLQPRAQRYRSTTGLVTSTSEITRLDRVTIDGLECTSGTRTVVQLLLTCSERERWGTL